MHFNIFVYYKQREVILYTYRARDRRVYRGVSSDRFSVVAVYIQFPAALLLIVVYELAVYTDADKLK